jgi:hypothetical protein
MLAFFLGFVTCYAVFVTSYLVVQTRQVQRSNSRDNHPTNGGWN